MSHAAAVLTSIERELRIAAPPGVVFALLTDASRANAWMGRQVQFDPRPGGIARIDYNGFDVMRGQFLEVVPNERVVLSWGWETLGDSMPPGASRVEFTLTPDGDGTLLRMVHSGLHGLDAESHAQGWDMFLPQLAQAAGGAPPASAPALSPGEELASRLNAQLIQLRYVIEGCDDATWAAACPGEGRTVGVVAQHITGHTALAHFAVAVAAGESSPFASFTTADIDQSNARFAAERAATTRAAALAELREQGAAAVDAVKQLTAEDLSRTQPMAFAGGAHLSAGQILAGPLLGHVAGHFANLQKAVS